MKICKVKTWERIPKIHYTISVLLILFVWVFLALYNKEIPSLKDFIGFSFILVGFYLFVIIVPWFCVPRPVVLKSWFTVFSVYLILSFGWGPYTYIKINTIRPFELFGLPIGIIRITLVTLMPLILTFLFTILDKSNVKSNYIPLFVYPVLIFLTLNKIVKASSTPYMKELLVEVIEKNYPYSDLESKLLSKDRTIKRLELELKENKATISDLQSKLDSSRAVCTSKKYVRTFSVEVPEGYFIKESRSGFFIKNATLNDNFIYISEIPCECVGNESGDIYRYSRKSYDALESLNIGVASGTKGDTIRGDDIIIDGLPAKVFITDYESSEGFIEIRYQFSKNGVRYIAGAHIYPSDKENGISLSEAQRILSTIKIN